ncbi:MAG TPA: DNA polymerase III subunit alpha, partial [Pirellulales bacterium]|nr:DNA polymerase III subunit alpha [Pirellulales bacterium]
GPISEKCGLLKMDFLGLRTLTTLTRSVDLVKQIKGIDIDIEKVDFTDKKVLGMFCRGETKGIFQLESGGIRDLLQRMKPDHFRDIIATNALYRPGPLEGGMVDDYIQVKHGRKAAEYLHDVMKEILEETNGVMVYQEQVMRILNRLGDIELSSAYTCIKAISKKKLPMIAKFREEFLTGATAKGISKKQAEDLFGMIEKFAGYGFNKSHSTAYALIAYMTAYLKAHYSVEFMAALLSGDISGRNFKKKDSLVEHLEDCRRMEIEVIPPNVNLSYGDFIVTDGKIVFGLSAIKGCGGQAADAIVAARNEGGPFRDLFDFCERVDPSSVNRTAIDSLIKAGAFDVFGAKRSQWTAVLEKALQAGASALADRRSGQKGLFDDAEDEPADVTQAALPDLAEWDERELLAGEKEVLGFYLSSHPLAEYQKTLETYCTHTTVGATALPHRTEVMLGGMIASIKFSHTKNPRPGSTHTKYAMFDLEDMQGIMRTIVWPEEFANCGHLVQADAVLAARGVIDKRPGSEEANFIVNELIPLEELPARFTKGMRVQIDETKHGERGLEMLREIIRGYPGNCAFQLVLSLADGSRVYCNCDDVKVELNSEMRSRIDDLLGAGNYRLLAAPPKAKAAPPPGRNGFRRAGAGA